MKKTVIFTMLSLFVMAGMQLQAQETKSEQKSEQKALRKARGSEVSQMTQNKFNSDFGKAQNVAWNQEGDYDEVTFTLDGVAKSAFYDDRSDLVGISQMKAFSDLPAKAQQEINSKYKDYIVEKVIFYDDNEVYENDIFMYGIQSNHADNYFVELANPDKTIVLQVPMTGEVTLFRELE